jgi:hypothetical protein
LSGKALALNNYLHWRVRLLVGMIALTVITGPQSASAASLSSTPLPANGALADAETALLNGDYQTAIAHYTAALDNPALHCEALYGLGVTHSGQRSMKRLTAHLRHLTECALRFKLWSCEGSATTVRQSSGRAGGLPAVVAESAFSTVICTNVWRYFTPIRVCITCAWQPSLASLKASSAARAAKSIC